MGSPKPEKSQTKTVTKPTLKQKLEAVSPEANVGMKVETVGSCPWDGPGAEIIDQLARDDEPEIIDEPETPEDLELRQVNGGQVAEGDLSHSLGKDEAMSGNLYLIDP